MEFKFDYESVEKEHKLMELDSETVYDILIIGGGPAAMTSAVYCMRKGVNTGIIIKELGGQVIITSSIENYMGFRYVEGSELADKFREQVLQFGIGFDEGNAVKKITAGEIKTVHMEDGRIFSARALIIATGKDPRRLNVPGEVELTGRGVAYSTHRDTQSYKDKKVIVTGGGNSGVESAIDLAKVCESVTVVQYKDKLSADQILIDKLTDNENVKVVYNHQVEEIKGSDSVSSVILNNSLTEEKSEVGAHCIVIVIGLAPNSGIVKDVLKLNKVGEIIIDNSCKTNEDGIFACGDVTDVPFKQIIVAAGEGAKAALSACEYILGSAVKW